MVMHLTLYKRQNFEWVQIETICSDKVSVTEKFKFVMGRVENSVEKGENAGNQHFLLFPQCFLLYQRQSLPF